MSTWHIVKSYIHIYVIYEYSMNTEIHIYMCALGSNIQFISSVGHKQKIKKIKQEEHYHKHLRRVRPVKHELSNTKIPRD